MSKVVSWIVGDMDKRLNFFITHVMDKILQILKNLYHCLFVEPITDRVSSVICKLFVTEKT